MPVSTPWGVPLPVGIAPFALLPGGWCVHLQCPHCGSWMRHRTFHRVRVAVTDSHERAGQLGKKGKMCRVVVVPDPTGDQHVVFRVEDQMEFLRAMNLVCERLGSAA